MSAKFFLDPIPLERFSGICMTNAESCRKYREKRKKHLAKTLDPYLRKDPVHRGAYNRPVSQYSMTGRLIASHPTIRGATRSLAKELGCPGKHRQLYRNLYRCLQGMQDSAYGYRWAETSKDMWVSHAGVSGFWPGLKKALPRKKRKRPRKPLRFQTFLRNVIDVLKTLESQQIESCSLTQFKNSSRSKAGEEIIRSVAFLIRKKIVKRVWISHRYYRIFPVTGQWNYKSLEYLLEEGFSKFARPRGSTGPSHH